MHLIITHIFLGRLVERISKAGLECQLYNAKCHATYVHESTPKDMGNEETKEQGILFNQCRRKDLDALLALLQELGEKAPEAVQCDLKALWHHVQFALLHLMRFVGGWAQVQ